MDTKEMIVWIIGLVLGFAFVCMPIACTMQGQHLVAEAIKNGADPIAAKCAIVSDGENRSSSMCISKVAGK